MMFTKKRLLAVFAIVLVTCVILAFFLNQPVSKIIRVLLGLVYLLFLPGYVFCYFMFPDSSEVDTSERIGLSVGVSVSLTMMLVLVMDIVFHRMVTVTSIVQSIGVFMLVVLISGFMVGKLRKTPEDTPNPKT